MVYPKIVGIKVWHTLKKPLRSQFWTSIFVEISTILQGVSLS